MKQRTKNAPLSLFLSLGIATVKSGWVFMMHIYRDLKSCPSVFVHFSCVTSWSEHTAVQVVSWRMLSRLRSAGWPQELIDQMYFEDTLAWAQATGEGEEDENKVIHREQQRSYLRVGDSVVLIKDLK
jgi:hypothetical protein